MKKIKGYPQELGKIYAELLERIDRNDVPETLRILEWISLAQRPLFVDDLRFAVCLEDSMVCHSLKDLERSDHWCSSEEAFTACVRDLTQGLVREATIGIEEDSHPSRQLLKFDHESVREFMLDSGLETLYARLSSAIPPPSLADLHISLAGRCLKFVMFDEITHLRKLEQAIAKKLADEDLAAQRYRYRPVPTDPTLVMGENVPPPLTFYAAQHWRDHIYHADEDMEVYTNILKLWSHSSRDTDWITGAATLATTT
ncbi:hypothetical protein LTR97_004230 [Elasticomyces elasticus]|uniref:Uncharacterized protein n=1 Tax=Elasticomyces elasticus TaxID=574655 RepID=A0AAN7WD12_9PEZI|nr:hypothetical protein LTR97_004230 [Elasticomyces elasticus]